MNLNEGFSTKYLLFKAIYQLMKYNTILNKENNINILLERAIK